MQGVPRRGNQVQERNLEMNSLLSVNIYIYRIYSKRLYYHIFRKFLVEGRNEFRS